MKTCGEGNYKVIIERGPKGPTSVHRFRTEQEQDRWAETACIMYGISAYEVGTDSETGHPVCWIDTVPFYS